MDHSESNRLHQPVGALLQRLFHAAPDTTDAPEVTAPPINRGSMVPVPWVGVGQGLKTMWANRGQAADLTNGQAPWERAAASRRNTLTWLVIASAIGAALLLAHSQPMFDHPVLRFAQVGLFSLLFAWVSAGFFTAMMGFVVQLRGDKHALSLSAARHQTLHADARTAIIMPICNEQVSTVFAGLRATYESLATTGSSGLFDVYVLSDTSDLAVRDAELAAWRELRDTLGEGSRIHYRWRQRRSRRKAGNVADFCRRWGKNYRYMVVLDADSVMSGDCLVTMVKLMEAHPKAGIIQTAPQASGLETIHARSQQFAGRTTGRLFTTGMQFWQLGESHYWGHNAIIRVEPFMKHCALADLAGTGGLSGHIMSHDFVEAALMRRAGYHTWLVPDLSGSYEQQPPNLLEELKRDRRWCQGNLQNARLIAEPGLHAVHRAMLATGAMAYVSAPLWLASVLLGAAVWLFSGRTSLIPAQGLPLEMIALWIGTVTMLLLPRALGVVAIVMKGEQALYGGTFALARGAILEAGLSVLQAPIRMVAHSIFVIVALTGLKLDWKSPPREAAAVSWRDAAGSLGVIFGVVLVAMIAALVFAPSGAIWLMPVALPLLLAMPLVVATGRPALGLWVRAKGLLVTPEEASTPEVLVDAWRYAEESAPVEEAAPANNASSDSVMQTIVHDLDVMAANSSFGADALEEDDNDSDGRRRA